HVADPCNRIGVVDLEPSRKPLADKGLGDRFDPMLAYRPRPLGEIVGTRHPRRTAAEHQAIDALRRIRRDPDADHPAQREPTEEHAVEPYTVEQIDHG